jgi:signal transduction histidine kinase
MSFKLIIYPCQCKDFILNNNAGIQKACRTCLPNDVYTGMAAGKVLHFRLFFALFIDREYILPWLEMKFKLVILAVIIIVSAIFAKSGLLWNESEWPQLGPMLPLEYRTNTVNDFLIFDIDGDGADEACILRSDRDRRYYLAIRELDQEGGSKTSTAVDLWEKHPQFITFHQGPYPFALLSEKGQAIWINFYNRKLERIDSLALATIMDTGEQNPDDRAFCSFYIQDLNNDLRPDLLAVLGEQRHIATPGIWAFDLFLHKMLWRVALQGQVLSTTWADAGVDLPPELIMTMDDSSSALSSSSTSDGGSDLAVLKPEQGSIFYKKRICRSSSQALTIVADVEGDGQQEIIVVTFAADARASDGFSLSVIDRHSFSRKNGVEDQEDHLTYANADILDTNQDRYPELYLFSTESIIRKTTFASALVSDKIMVSGKNPRLCFHDDINGDGNQELFIQTERPSRLWITDGNLQPLAWLPLSNRASSTRIHALDRAGAKVRHYALLNDGVLSRLPIPLWRLFPPAPVQLNWRQHALGLHPAAVIFLILCPLLAIGFLIWLLTSDRAKTKRQVLPESQRIGMLLLNHRFRVQECNAHFLQVTELLRTQVLKHSLHHVFAADTLKPLRDVVSLYRQRGEKYLKHEISLGAEDRRRNVEVEIIALSRLRTILLLVDISEAAQAERLRVWSSMAQHLVQKTRTPLASLLSAIQRLQRSYRKQVPQLAAEYDGVTHGIAREVESVRDGIDSFLKFSKLEEPFFQEDDFTQVVQSALNEYLQRFPETIELRTVYQDIRLPVRVDRKQIKDVFFNIMDNAVAAISMSGEITVSTAQETHPLQDWGGQSYALLEISDSGVGIPAEDLVRLYDPGFTTSANGSGMGLTVTRSIVQSHGGGIFIASGPGAGTTVSIRLPLLEQPGEESVKG